MHEKQRSHQRNRREYGRVREAKKLSRLLVGRVSLLVVFSALIPHPGAGFTQSAGIDFAGHLIPMGHEWITRLAALELLGGDPIIGSDPKDPRNGWTRGTAKNPSLSGGESEVNRILNSKYPADKRYMSTYKPVFDAIIGERWVDIAGFNIAGSVAGAYNCWDAVAQQATAVQYDHFLRRYSDSGSIGGVAAAKASQDRFTEYFLAAAMAPRTNIRVWDGGGYASEVLVDLNYFLFGRAVHLFQDSFSSEHAVRIASDQYEKVRQVKSYLCAAGAEQHVHGIPFGNSSGDVIWTTSALPDWSSYKPSNMKARALVALEATKDLWAAFIRVMSTPQSDREKVARTEASVLIQSWLSFNENEMLSWYDDEARRDDTYVLASGQSGKGKTVSKCMKALGVRSGTQEEKVREIEEHQRICLFNIIAKERNFNADEYSPHLADAALSIPYNWMWKSSTRCHIPPKDWTNDKNGTFALKSVASRGLFAGNCQGCIHERQLVNRSHNSSMFVHSSDPTSARSGWILERRPNGYFTLRSCETGKYAAVCRECINDGAGRENVFIHVDNPNMRYAQWNLEDAEDGRFSIRSIWGKRGYMHSCRNCVAGRDGYDYNVSLSAGGSESSQTDKWAIQAQDQCVGIGDEDVND